MSPDQQFGWHADHSPCAVRPLSPDELDSLRARGVAVLVTSEYVVREGERVIKEVVFQKGIH